ncbi:MAG: AI-2E family transporter, partial [Ruminococcaceae bacterium]|nr:AI-2E family transporter [Oscillospiraceae bacterium]
LLNLGKVLGVIGNVLSVFMPFIIGLCIAFVTNVLLRPLEKLWDKIPDKKWLRWLKKPKRAICIIISELIIFGVIFVLLFMVIPEISDTVKQIADSMPDFFEKAEKWWDGFTELLAEHSIVLPQMDLDIGEIAGVVTTYISSLDFSLWDTTMNITGAVFGAVFNTVLGFAFSLYVLALKEKLGANITKALNALLPQKKVNSILEVASLSNKTFTNFVTGQLAEAFIIGTLCFVGMLIFNMPYAPAVSVLVGATALIPVFGPFIGTGIGAFLILMESPGKVLWFILFIAILQQLEGNLIYPKVVGKSVGLPGIWVLVVVTVGGGLFGIVGMLVGIPVFTVVYTLIKQSLNKKLAAKGMEVMSE